MLDPLLIFYRVNLQPFWERDDAKICSVTAYQGNFHCNDSNIKKNNTVGNLTCTLLPSEAYPPAHNASSIIDKDAIITLDNGGSYEFNSHTISIECFKWRKIYKCFIHFERALLVLVCL